MTEFTAQSRLTKVNVNTLRFFRTPKGLLIIVLSMLMAIAATGTGIAIVAPGIFAAALVAMLVDAPILRYREGEWQFPSGALLTGMLVAMILTPHEHWYYAAFTSLIAVLSKYVARTRSANVFNPAAVAIVATYFMFRTGQSWWGALPELAPFAIVMLFATGIFITQRVNKFPAVLAFLGVYFLLCTLATFVADPAHVTGLFRAPDVHAALFFAFFMVTDPPTSPPKQRDQLIFGIIVAVVSFFTYEFVRNSVYFLLAGLLVGNAWEAWRRGYHRRMRKISAGRNSAAAAV
ncbi:MAG: RnfABCDGE type electron transport complex subunit D [Gemmatimonadota bacterium]|nr:RnfABCDGE type electron transport complex subunit D [Gemmatimonadota bacterium]